MKVLRNSCLRACCVAVVLLVASVSAIAESEHASNRFQAQLQHADYGMPHCASLLPVVQKKLQEQEATINRVMIQKPVLMTEAASAEREANTPVLLPRFEKIVVHRLDENNYITSLAVN